MAVQINLNIDGNFLLVEDTSTGNVTNYPLSYTSYQVFTPQDIDPSSSDNKNYLYFKLLDGSKIKSGGYDIFCENANYEFFSVALNRLFISLGELIDYLDNNLATPASLPYKVFTALLTQSGTGTEDSINSGELTIGRTYYINQESASMDFTNVGALSNDLGTSFIATGTTPNSWGDGAMYTLAYDAGAPVATVLENTIGNLWFTYNGTGNYTLNSDGLFTDSTWTNISLNIQGFGDNLNFSIYKYSTNHIGIVSGIGGDSQYNDYLDQTCIEVRVYN
jgi:hypothetical protein